MRQHNSIERRRDRVEFANMYRDKLLALEKLDNLRHPAIREWIEQNVRRQLEYSPRTYYIDIYITLVKDLTRIIHIKK